MATRTLILPVVLQFSASPTEECAYPAHAENPNLQAYLYDI